MRPLTGGPHRQEAGWWLHGLERRRGLALMGTELQCGDMDGSGVVWVC
jgi:hypothetical protein